MLEGHVVISGPAVDVIRRHAKIIQQMTDDVPTAIEAAQSKNHTIALAVQKILDQLPNE